MRRILIVQPSFQPPGGGNGVAAWTLQALVGHDVTTLSWTPIEVEPINRFFGTRLRATDFKAMVLPARWTGGIDRAPLPLALIRSALLMRYSRRVSDRFDVIVGLHNETDFGRRGIQYVHYPTYFRPRPQVDLRWYHRFNPVLQAYYRFADRLGGFSLDRIRSNVTLVNSHWTGTKVQAVYDIETTTVYPPVSRASPDVPWERRRAGFLAVGRISPEKELERVLRIMASVREVVPDLTLTIVGTWDRHVRRYYEGLRRQAAALGSWIEFRHDLTRAEIHGLMATHRYGIHGMREEHFGMAPAEMALAGMLVWVPNGGGQVEIVDASPALVYDHESAAAAQILAVLSSPTRQDELRTRLAAHADRFTSERFVLEMQRIVEAFRG